MRKKIIPLVKDKWEIDDIRSQEGKVFVITGANSGLGYFSTKVLSSKGAEVVMAVRSMEKGEKAREAILEEYPEASLNLMELDLSSLDSIHQFSEQFKDRFNRLDVLINNAGIMQPPRLETVDGFELQFGVNHLGHFALTGLLLPVLINTGGSRVVTQSSIAHLFGKINFDDINHVRRYGRTKAYAQSKIANLYFSYELDRRLRQINSSTISVAVHPGYTRTNLQKSGPQIGGKSLMSRVYSVIDRIFAQKVEMGSLPMLYASTMDDIEGGDFIGPKRIGRGYPKRIRSNKRSYDLIVAKKLWELSEKMTGIEYQFDQNN